MRAFSHGARALTPSNELVRRKPRCWNGSPTFLLATRVVHHKGRSGALTDAISHSDCLANRHDHPWSFTAVSPECPPVLEVGGAASMLGAVSGKSRSESSIDVCRRPPASVIVHYWQDPEVGVGGVIRGGRYGRTRQRTRAALASRRRSRLTDEAGVPAFPFQAPTPSYDACHHDGLYRGSAIR